MVGYGGSERSCASRLVTVQSFRLVVCGELPRGAVIARKIWFVRGECGRFVGNSLVDKTPLFDENCKRSFAVGLLYAVENSQRYVSCERVYAEPQEVGVGDEVVQQESQKRTEPPQQSFTRID